MTDYGMMLLSGINDSVALKTDEDKETVVEAVETMLTKSENNE
jgi:hypothetical protein